MARFARDPSPGHTTDVAQPPLARAIASMGGVRSSSPIREHNAKKHPRRTAITRETPRTLVTHATDGTFATTQPPHSATSARPHICPRCAHSPKTTPSLPKSTIALPKDAIDLPKSVVDVPKKIPSLGKRTIDSPTSTPSLPKHAIDVPKPTPSPAKPVASACHCLLASAAAHEDTGKTLANATQRKGF